MVKINFPFFPLGSYSGWYCGQVAIQGESGLEIHLYTSTNKAIPPASPYVSFSEIDWNVLKTLCDEKADLISVKHHYLAYIPDRNENKIKKVYVLINFNLQPGEKLKGVKFSNDDSEGLILGSEKKITEFEQLLKRTGKIRIFEPGKKRELSNLRFSEIDVEKVKSYPLILNWPFYMTDKLLSKEKSWQGSLIFVKALLGSVVLEKKHKYKYVFKFFPTPSLSACYMQNDRKPVSPLVLPSVNIYDSGVLAIELDLKGVARDLYVYLKNSLIDAFKLLKNNEFELSFEPYPIRKHEGDTVPDRPRIEANSVLKTLVNSFLVAGPTISVKPSNDQVVRENDRSSESSNDIERDLRLYVKSKHPHRSYSYNIKIRVRDTVFNQMDMSSDDDKHYIELHRTFVHLNRTKFLIQLFVKLYNIGLRIRNPEKYDKIVLLLASYLGLLSDFIEEFMDERNISLSKEAVKLDIDLLAKRITVLLLEYGLHGVSHLLMQHISNKLKIKKSDLNEITVLLIPSQSKGFHQFDPARLCDAFNSLTYYINNVFDGYHYRLYGKQQTGLTGLILIADSNPYTAYSWRRSLESFDLYEFVSESVEFLNERDCYMRWKDRREKLKPTVNYVVAHLRHRDRVQGDLFEELLRMLGKLFNVEEGDTALETMYPPTSEFRRFLTYKENFAGRLLASHSIPREKQDKFSEELTKGLRYHIHALIEYLIPFCFDGCYNCVSVEKGCAVRNPLL
uniref:Uncharacterized protein n=1 Tax=Thermosphaera aggregans TaxID=54254 RepID=A0A7C2BKS5_9CREN